MRSVRVLSSIVALLLLMWDSSLPAAAAESAAAPRPRAALVIGNVAYTAVQPLKNAGNDAHDMCDALTELGYTVSCLADVKDAREFKARVQDFAAGLKPKSEVVFYYAGHAIQVKGENYLVPISARLRSQSDVARETISLNYVMQQLSQARHYLNIVILDACRSNPWSDGSHGLTSGLAPITAIPRGSMVMYATAANDVSDDGEGRNGVLTKNLLANIRTPGLTADEFFKHVSEGVQADSSAAVGHTQTPAMYTNFTGEFCFAGCIDKVARAELERQQKASEQQLEQIRKEKSDLEQRSREAEQKLVATTLSMNCDKSALNDNGRCFTALSDATAKAAASALIQRGFVMNEGSRAIEATRSVDNPQDKNLTDITTVTMDVKPVAVTGHSVVTIAANLKTVKHDEYHNWTHLTILPVPTSKEYRDVVKKDITITDASFFEDLFAGIERNLRAANTAGIGTPTDPSVTAAADANFWAPGPQPAAPTPGHEHLFDNSTQKLRSALIEAVLDEGYIVVGFSDELGLLNALRRLQDPKDKHSSITTALSISLVKEGSGSRVQASAEATHTLRHESGGRGRGAPLAGVARTNQTESTRGSAITDPAYYRDLFASVDAVLQGSAISVSGHAKQFELPSEQLIRGASDRLTQKGYRVSALSSDLLTATRQTTSNSKKDELLTTEDTVTVFIRPDPRGGSLAQLSASSRQSVSNAIRFVGSDSARGILPLLQSQNAFMSMGTVIHEGDADPGVYAEVLNAIDPTH